MFKSFKYYSELMPIYSPNVFNPVANGFATGRTIQFQLHTYQNNATWTKPANLLAVEVFVLGGGAGGGSGSRTATNVISRAGSTGIPGLGAYMYIEAGDLNATEDVVIGAGGTGGAHVTADNTTGASGTSGGQTSFGAHMISPVSPFIANNGASTWSTSPIQNAAYGRWPIPIQHPFVIRVFAWHAIASGSLYNNTPVQSPDKEVMVLSGGTGGGITSANVQYAGMIGGRYFSDDGSSYIGGASGGDASSGNGHGDNGTNDFIKSRASGPIMQATGLFGDKGIGSGGGGGASRLTAKGGNAGNSGKHGVGGAGGGSSRNGHDSGHGAAGTEGLVKVLEILLV